MQSALRLQGCSCQRAARTTPCARLSRGCCRRRALRRPLSSACPCCTPRQPASCPRCASLALMISTDGSFPQLSLLHVPTQRDAICQAGTSLGSMTISSSVVRLHASCALDVPMSHASIGGERGHRAAQHRAGDAGGGADGASRLAGGPPPAGGLPLRVRARRRLRPRRPQHAGLPAISFVSLPFRTFQESTSQSVPTSDKQAEASRCVLAHSMCRYAPLVLSRVLSWSFVSTGNSTT